MSSSPSQPLRLAFIGAGGIAGAHTTAINNHPDKFQMVAICDMNRAAAEEAAARFPNAKEITIYADYNVMLNEIGDKLDGAIVVLPHWLHCPAAAACLEHKVPALVEKPAAISVAEMRQLMELEKKHGTFVQAGQMQRFGAEENWIKNWLHTPEFGEPLVVNLDVYQNGDTLSVYGKHWILDGKKAGGGIVASVGIHILDLIRYWLDDDYAELCAFGRFDPPFINKAESTVVATFKMKKGIMGTLNACYSTRRTAYSQRTVMYGTNGSLYQHLATPGSYAGEYYTSTSNGVPDKVWEHMFLGFKPVAEQMPASGSADGPGWPFTAQMIAFGEAIRQGKATENSLERNFNTIAVIETIARSLESGKPEMVETL